MPKTKERLALHPSSRSLKKTTFKPATHLKRATESDLHFEKSESHFRPFALSLSKNQRFAGKTKELIPNPGAAGITLDLFNAILCNTPIS